MLETRVFVTKKPKLRNPICIVGLPGIGNIGRIAVGYMVHELKAKKFAELYSPYFFPFVMIHNNMIHTLRNEFYYCKTKKRDIILLIGDCQTYDPKGHYEVVGKILDFLKTFGCKAVITVGGFGTGRVSEKPKVYGAATNSDIIKDYKKYGINFDISGQIGTIVGASGLLVGLARSYGMEGMVLLGETTGFPIITDPTAAEAVLRILEKILKIKIDLTKIDEKVKAMHDFIKRLEDVQKQAISQMKKRDKPEELKYIG
ncbi:MAG: proteasome assembly chaperone family protein [Candidatus Aenigmarchaeota archaeon]|nr:proteasome assembly chaperone family protein [Candidatus Aenigmarchaeota archaeon]